MAAINQLVDYIDELLAVPDCQDYCPNGLQVEGQYEVNHIVCGVTASEELIRAALDRGADTLLVHHGYFWRGEDMRVVGMKKKRLNLLLQHNLNLLAYHLPLDLHPTIGNNAQIASRLGVKVEGDLPSPAIGQFGALPSPVSPQDFLQQLATVFARPPLHLSGGNEKISRLAWCSGAGQNFIAQAYQLGVDAYISGEVSEQTYHFARENKVDYYAVGHHASERYGVQELAKLLADKFGVKQEYVELLNPV